MKTIILVALLVGIAVATSSRDYTKFRAGQQYKYVVQSQSLTGMPHLAQQFSGVRYDVHLTLQIDSGNYATLKFDEVRFFQLNDELSELPVKEIVKDSEKWQPVDNEQRQQYEDCFAEPISFLYDHGLIRNLKVPRVGDWCSNLQKGILSLFQADMSQQQERVDTDLTDLLRLSKSRINLHQDYDTTFRVMEESIDGECESVYVIQEQEQRQQDEQVMEVSKIRNYDNCRFRPISQEGMLSDYVADVQNPHNHTHFRSTSRSNATIVGNRDEFLIVGVKQTASHVYTPLKEENGEIATFSVQEMKFLGSHQTENKIQPAYYTKECPEGLKMILPKDQKETEDQENSQNRVQIIDQLVGEYVSKCSPKVTREALQILPKLMYALRDSSSQDIIDVFQAIRQAIQQSGSQQDSIHTPKMKVLLDVISSIGRQNVIPVMEFLIEQNYVEPSQAASLISTISLTVKPTDQVVNAFMPSAKLYTLSLVRNTPYVRKAALLASGTILHGFRKAQRNEPNTPAVYREHIERYTKEMQELYRQSEDESEKVAILKAISNSGIPEFLQFLRECIDQSPTLPLRINAVMAMRRMPQEMTLKVHNQLLSVYLDRSEPQQVRVAAYLVLMKTRPNYGTVHSILASLYGEKAKQVGDFVYTHLQSIALSSRASLEETRQFVRILMKEAEPFISQKYYKNSYSLDMLAKELGVGAYLDLFFTESTRTVFPAGFNAIFGTTVYGREMEMIEMGMELSGLQDMVSRLLGPKSFLRDLLSDEEELSKEFMDVVKQLLNPQRTPSMGKVDKFVKDLIQKLGLSQQTPEQLNYEAYLKVLGNELRFLELKAEDIVSWLEREEQGIVEYVIDFLNKLKQGKALNMMQTMTGETTYVVPSPLGIPISLNESYSHILRLTGNTKLTGNLFGLTSDVKLDTTATPSAAVMTIGQMGLQLPLLRSGVTMESWAQLQDTARISLQLNSQSKQLSMKYYAPEQQRDAQIAIMESVPYTYTHRLHTDLKQNIFQSQLKEITNTKFVKPYTMTVPYESKVIGQTFEHTIEVPTPVVAYAPVRPFTGRHSYVLKRKEIASPNQKIQLQLQYSNQEKQEQQGSQERSNYRSSSRSTEDLDEFETVKVDARISSPVKQVLYMTLQTQETPAPINLKSMLTILKDQNSKQCQINIQVTEDYYKGTANIFADLHKIMNPSKDSQKEDLADLSAQIAYDGEEYSASATIRSGDLNSEVKIPAEPYCIFKLRQLFSLPNPTSQQSQASWSLFGEESYKEDQDNSPVERGLLEFPEFRTNAYKYSMELKYSQTPESLQEKVYQWFQMLVNSNKYDVTVSTPQEAEDGRVDLSIRFKPNMEMIHVEVKGPSQDTTFFCPARFPAYLHRALTYSSDLIFFDDNKEQEKVKAQCVVDSRSTETRVQTFDGVSYQLPEMSPDCQILLSKSYDQLFTILMARPEGRQELTIVLPQTEIKLRGSTRWERPQAELNGEELDLQSGPQLLSIGSSKQLIEISRQDNTIKVHSQKLGLKIEIIDEQISIKTSPLHSGEVRGICGDYNGESHREMSGPKRQQYQSAKEFVLSYVLPSDNCDVDALKTQHNIQPETEQCSLKKESKVMTRQQYGEQQVCISQEEVPKCPRGCRPSKEQTLRQPVVCFPAHSQEARRLAQEVKYRPLSQIRHNGMKEFEEITMPTQCQPDY